MELTGKAAATPMQPAAPIQAAEPIQQAAPIQAVRENTFQHFDPRGDVSFSATSRDEMIEKAEKNGFRQFAEVDKAGNVVDRHIKVDNDLQLASEVKRQQDAAVRVDAFGRQIQNGLTQNEAAAKQTPDERAEVEQAHRDFGTTTAAKEERRASIGIEKRNIDFAGIVLDAKHDKLNAIPVQDVAARLAEANRPEPNAVPPEVTRQWAALDAQEYTKLQDPDRQQDAAITIAENMRVNADYRQALESRAPEIAAEVSALAADNHERMAAKEVGKAAESVAMGLDEALRAQEARIAARDGSPSHSGSEASREAERAIDMGAKGSSIDNAELDKLLAEQKRRMADLDRVGVADADKVNEAAPAGIPMNASIEELAKREEARLRELMKGEEGVTPEDTRAELMEHNEHRGQGKVAEGEREEEARRREREAQQRGLNEATVDDRAESRRPEPAKAADNSFDVQRTGRELDKGDFIMPRRIEQTYTEIDGKFYAKDSNRVMFEDKGDKLATSTTDKVAVADMVALAKAKQWDSLKLAGSQDFRREVWLQAESQGIKTQGYTPKAADLAALETLRQQRTTNMITPLQERSTAKSAGAAQDMAPRNNLDKSQANLHAEATKNIATNMQALQKIPGMTDKSTEELAKLAYWRGVVSEENKEKPKAQEEALARFDAKATDPAFVKALPQETEPRIQERTTERVQGNNKALDGQSL